MRGTPEERFNAMITPEPNTGCWLWTSTISRTGYGKIWNNGRLVLAHRYAYEMAKGPIPEGLQVDHTCSVTCCVNPEHLEAVTPRENCRRTIDRGRGNNGQSVKTHCPAGHPYAGDNLYESSNGHRHCRACGARHKRAYENNGGRQRLRNRVMAREASSFR